MLIDRNILDPIKQEYSLNDKKLEAVDYHKHLGVTISGSLFWDYHINSICAKGRRVIGLTRRAFGFKSPAAVEVAFKTLVRPLLEYCCAAWNPGQPCQLN